MELSIIIVAYNNGKELADCLESINLYNDLGDQLEVLVVDNSSSITNVVKTIVSRFSFAQYIPNSNGGFGQGNNCGFYHSKGKYLLFLNPDTIITTTCFSKMINLHSIQKKCGISGFKLIDNRGKDNNSYNIRFNYGFFNKMLLKICRFFGIFLRKKMYTCGAAIFIERSFFEQIGCFDEKIFMYSEETDLSLRAELFKKRVFFWKTIKIIHLQGKSTENNGVKTRERMLISDSYCAKKYNKNFKKMLKSEIRFMKFIHFFNKNKYNDKIIQLYENYREK